MTNYGYSSDQFRNFELYEKGTSLRRNKVDNPQFLYPGNYRHDVFGEPFGTSSTDHLVKRGFIRGILPRKLRAGLDRRLFFQFNPATLDRTVDQNELTLNPLLQDPANLLSPVPGNAYFSFELIFNREAEVNSHKFKNANGEVVDRPVGSLLNNPNNTTVNPFEQYGGSDWNAGDVSTIGVLADLYVLDSIIGQSITPDLAVMLKKWNFPDGKPRTDPTSTSDGSSPTGSVADFESRFNKNIGNSAFLSPLPVRMVFSSMFMVEGYVERSSVQFIKFTSSYVPTLCKVTLSVRALYFGFAKESTYLSNEIDTFINPPTTNTNTRTTTQGISTVPSNAKGVVAGLDLITTVSRLMVKDSSIDPNIYVNAYGQYNDFKDYADTDRSYRFEGTISEGTFSSLLGTASNVNKANSLKTLVKTMVSADVRFYLEIRQVLSVPNRVDQITILFSQQLKVTTKNNKAISSENMLREIANKKASFKWVSPAFQEGAPLMNADVIGDPIEGNRKRRIEFVVTAFVDVVVPIKKATAKGPKFDKYRTILSGVHALRSNSLDDFEDLADGKGIKLKVDPNLQWRPGPSSARDVNF